MKNGTVLCKRCGNTRIIKFDQIEDGTDVFATTLVNEEACYTQEDFIDESNNNLCGNIKFYYCRQCGFLWG